MARIRNLKDALTAMENVLRWLARGVHNLHHFYGRETEDEVRGTFEHVDSKRLDASGFRASDSMGLHDLPAFHLPDTRPSRFRTLPTAHRRSAVARVGRGFAA
jgi:hypothetical protein